MKKILIKKNNSLKEALYKLNTSGEKCLIIVNDNNKLIGTLSDGDLRKGLLLGSSLNEKISKIYNKNPTFLYENEHNNEDIKKIFIKYKFDLLPIVRQNKQVIDYVTLTNLLTNSQKIQKSKINNKISVVIMAGGRGTRLEPFTNILPKPLIPINNKTLIENIIETFENQNFVNFTVIANYKSHILKAYFKEIKKNKIKFIVEKNPLGTAASIKLLKDKVSDTFILSNCDIIAKMQYQDILEFHNTNKNDLTLLSSSMSYTIPYGVCLLDKKGNLKKLDEKPNNDFFVNVGLYVINKKIIKYIPSNSIYNMDSFISDLILKKKKIGIFPIHNDSWRDYGQWNFINKK